jgi:hypothetical protein
MMWSMQAYSVLGLLLRVRNELLDTVGPVSVVGGVCDGAGAWNTYNCSSSLDGRTTS